MSQFPTAEEAVALYEESESNLSCVRSLEANWMNAENGIRSMRPKRRKSVVSCSICKEPVDRDATPRRYRYTFTREHCTHKELVCNHCIAEQEIRT
jgi:hypothetical protein